MTHPQPGEATANFPVPDVTSAPPGPAEADAPTLAPSALGSAPADLPHIAGYDVLEELGRGGMGVVYKAMQRDLKRLVALKCILAGELSGGDQRDRFRREAEAVAHLHHPNIVQIYEIGETAGCPFFSLEYVDGGSLSAHLGGKPLPASAAARLVGDLARAVQHAHEAGIVHRDLKPANVLLQKDISRRGAEAQRQEEAEKGKTTGVLRADQPCFFSSGLYASATLREVFLTPKITDFGIAKQLNKAGTHTGTGAVLGTPSYMAPEQAEGKNKEVGPAADIYALGAILYECLTGRPPFQAATQLDIVLQVVGTEPIPPRKLNPSVPRDLEVICLKCLQKEPRKRYASAGELADDCGRFLDGKPINARPTPAWERALKWARRRPAVATLLGVCVAALAGLIGVAGWYNGRLQQERDFALAQRDEARLAREEAERQKRHADGLLHMALHAVDRLTQISPERLSVVAAEMTDEGRQRLQDALELCRGFLKEDSDNPAARQETGQTHTRIAMLLLLLGKSDEAKESIGKAVVIQQDLKQAFPDRADYAYDLAQGHLVQGHVGLLGGKLAEALASYEQAQKGLSLLAKQYPEDVRFQRGLAEGHRHLAFLFMNRGDFRRAEEHFRADLALYERLTVRHPDPEYLYLQTVGYLNVANVRINRDNSAAAEEPVGKALALYEKLVGKKRGTDPKYVQVFAMLQTLRGAILLQKGKRTEAQAAFQEGFDLHDGLLRGRPQARDHPWNLYTVFRQLHPLIKSNPAQVLTMSDRVIAGLEGVRTKEAGARLVALRTVLAMLRAIRARDALAPLGRYEEALADWDQAIEQIVPAFRPSFRLGRARTVAARGDYVQAIKDAQKVLAEKPRGGDPLFIASGVYATAALAVRRDHKLSEPERARRAEEYDARAVVLLGQAVEAGLDQFEEEARPANLRNLPELKALLKRDDFRKLLARLDEAEKFAGTWSIVAAERLGQPYDDALTVKVVFTGSRFTVRQQGQVLFEGSIRLDPSVTPKQIDSHMSSGQEKGRTRLGIYEIKGDRLRMCYSDFDKERPTAFSTREGTGFSLFVYQRDRPKK
jgi:uncharacterized protein (TIGR03067 family)